MTLNGKVCVITGSASGIGKAIAERYIADGAKVVIADLRLDAAQAAATELTAKDPGEAIGVEMNVTDEAAVNAGIQAACNLLHDRPLQVKLRQQRVEHGWCNQKITMCPRLSP